MAERSQHRASGGQDARSERPATGRGQPLAAHHVQPAATLTKTRLSDLLARSRRKLQNLDVGTGLGLRPGRQGNESLGHREADHVR